MSVTFTIDSKQQTVFTIVADIVNGQQLYEHQIKLGDNPNFKPDMRELMNCMDVKNADVKSMFSQSLVESSPWGSGAKRAIVVPNDFVFGLLRIFQTVMSGSRGEISIFRDLEKAKAWLNIQ